MARGGRSAISDLDPAVSKVRVSDATLQEWLAAILDPSRRQALGSQAGEGRAGLVVADFDDPDAWAYFDGFDDA